MEAGCDDYDTKPVEIARPLGKIAAHFEGGLSGCSDGRRVGREKCHDRSNRPEADRHRTGARRLRAAGTERAGDGDHGLCRDADGGRRAQPGVQRSLDDLQRILDASQTLHRLILSLLDPATFQHHEGSADLAEFRRKLRHDLRTPINAIKGYGEMLREDATDGGADAFVGDLDKMLAEATLLLDRIDGLVTYSDGDAPPSDGGPEQRGSPRQTGWSRDCSALRARRCAGRGRPCGGETQPHSGRGRQRLEPGSAVTPPRAPGSYRASSRGRFPRARSGRASKRSISSCSTL